MKVFAQLAVTLLFVGVAHGLLGLNCYTCDSSQPGQEHCMDGPFTHPSQQQTCTQSFNQVFGSYKSQFPDESFNDSQDSCVKFVRDDGHSRQVLRGCASGQDNVCNFLGANIPHVKCYTCKKNLCNGATSLSAVSVAFVALFSLVMAVKL